MLYCDGPPLSSERAPVADTGVTTDYLVALRFVIVAFSFPVRLDLR